MRMMLASVFVLTASLSGFAVDVPAQGEMFSIPAGKSLQ